MCTFFVKNGLKKCKMLDLGAEPRGTQRQFLENICSEDDLRSRISGHLL